jgi:beta-carotene 3-hydroxylase
MECVAWLTHKYVMHGFMWKVHKDHHVKNPNKVFELNDLFFLIFAAPGALLMYFGVLAGLNFPAFWIGLGITIYGAAYFFVHDLFIHQRIKVLKRTKNQYLLGIRRGHKTHHKHMGKEKGECFGMLLVPYKYFRFFK